MIAISIEKSRVIAYQLAQHIADMGKRATAESSIAAAVSVDELKAIVAWMKGDE